MNVIIHSFIALSLVYGTVESQICFKNKVFMTTVSDVYTKMVVQSYRGLCIGGSYVCIYTKNTPITSSRTRTVPQRKIISLCCEGYIRVDDSPYDSDIQCKPICMHGCINGYCKSPGQCSCNDGYVPANTESLKSLNNSCQPVCTKPCIYATCVAPETCNCDFGYANTTGTCKPVCTYPCHNGICSAPEICTCLPGYRKTDSNTCQPYCSHGCDNGLCSAPENCTCNPGYKISMVKDFLSTCQPVCNETCQNGECVAPNECNCLPNYRKSPNTTNCEPICSNSCENGYCSAPENCTCYPGYQLTRDEDFPLLETCMPIGSVPYNDDWLVTSSADSNDFTNTQDENITLNDKKTDNGTSLDIAHNPENSAKHSWMMEYSAAVLVPLMMLVLVSALIWKCSPIVLCFPQRCYVVQAPAIPLPFETVQFSELKSREREDKAATHNK